MVLPIAVFEFGNAVVKGGTIVIHLVYFNREDNFQSADQFF